MVGSGFNNNRNTLISNDIRRILLIGKIHLKDKKQLGGNMEEDNIYSTVPDELKQGNIPERNIILHYLKQHPGKFFNAIPLAKACGFPTGSTQVQIRLAITQLIILDEEPIVGNTKGFAYVTEPNMLKFYKESLIQRIQGTERKIKALDKIYNRMLNQRILK